RSRSAPTADRWRGAGTVAPGTGTVRAPIWPLPRRPRHPPASARERSRRRYASATVRLYNTLTRRLEDVVPVDDRHVRMYTCGPTVYRYAHIGNLRTFLLSDIVRLVLEFEGYEVTQIINITDVGHMVDD